MRISLMEKALATVIMLVSSMSANAGLTFSDLEFTETSFTFTIDGDLSGYDFTNTHNGVTDLSIVYYGDIWNQSNTSSSNNNWSSQIFDNNPIIDGGTGSWDSANLYTWIDTSETLSFSNVASNNTTTLTVSSNLFNTDIEFGQVDFIAGWGNSNHQSYGYRTELLGSVVIGSQEIPEPSSLAILGLGIAGLAFRRLKNKAA